MANSLQAPPVLSTPDTRLAEAATSSVVPTTAKSEDQLCVVYEIERTIREINSGGWTRVALQFPDSLLPDAPRVYSLLRERLKSSRAESNSEHQEDNKAIYATVQPHLSPLDRASNGVTLFILGDTSYSACCVDEIAAEHIDAEVVVHYGRACLSPTARLPVIHIFTTQEIDLAPVLDAFEQIYPEKDERVIIMADMPYASHVSTITESLRRKGYKSLFETTVRHSPSSPIPNRTIPSEAEDGPNELKLWRLFHISDPPPALLLTLASRVASIHIYPSSPSTSHQPRALEASTSIALRRRYALLTRLSRASIIGILVNTLSIHAYQAALEGAQARIAESGKKAYVFAMGRLNSAKVGNFAEVDGWVVLGCWESSLVENTEFDKPVIAPFELDLALQADTERVWTGQWRGDFDNLIVPRPDSHSPTNGVFGNKSGERKDTNSDKIRQESESESESEPPEFDLRTGRYITPSRPMGTRSGRSIHSSANSTNTPTHSLVKKARGDIALVAGELSPGAQYLRDQRTWRGLGSDFEIAYEEEENIATTVIKEGRSGIARGYENEKLDK